MRKALALACGPVMALSMFAVTTPAIVIHASAYEGRCEPQEHHGDGGDQHPHRGIEALRGSQREAERHRPPRRDHDKDRDKGCNPDPDNSATQDGQTR